MRPKLSEEPVFSTFCPVDGLADADNTFLLKRRFLVSFFLEWDETEPFGTVTATGPTLSAPDEWVERVNKYGDLVE
jgi:hypothetical protein